MTIAPAALLAALMIAVALGAIPAFIIGWNLSVSHWRHRNRELATQYNDMAEKWATMADAMERDPVRMGLNTGQEFILRELEAFCIRHRERLETMT